jgi:hypothetical protein
MDLVQFNATQKHTFYSNLRNFGKITKLLPTLL